MRRSVFVLLVLAASVHAGVYSPDDPCPFNVAPDGAVEALPHQLFVAQLVDRMASRVPNAPDPPGIPDWAYDTSGSATFARSTYAARLGQLIAARWTQAQQLRGDDLAAHTAALLRYNAPQQAINLLDRGRVGRSYTLKANRAHAFATERQWEDALTNLPDSDEPSPPPAGTTPVQFRWQRSLDQTMYRRWLELHEADFQKWKASSETHPDATPLPLFVTTSGDAIRYWESADEGKKLPADAIAVVQQLLLWAPWDDRLLWSLAEVYLAKGKIREAHSAYKMLATDEGRRYQGPRLLRPQLERVGAEYAKLPPEESVVTVVDSDANTPPKPDTSGLIFGLIDPSAFVVGLVVFVAIVGLMVAFQVRALRRRR